MENKFEMVAKTFRGLEDVLAQELRQIGADDVTPGNRMVSFYGDLAMLYKANFCCRTALRILKPFFKFKASDPEELYAMVKTFDWSTLMSADQTFAIDSVVFSEDFRNSQFVTYRVKDGIVDWFRDHEDDERRPRVRLDGADIMFNVHISGREVTLSLDSSGESLHKRGWRKAQTEAPINEVLAAGIILMSGWKGDVPFVDPMCGSGTFLIEAAMIAAGIYPGVYRRNFAFENWPDFNRELFEEIYNDDSAEREVTVPIVGADISPRAIEISRTNARNAGLERYITFEQRSIAQWSQNEVPQPAGVLVSNPPYGKRITADDMNALYGSIGTTLKHAFKGYHAWIIGYEDVYFHEIGLAPSQKVALNNGGLECELREYVIFEGSKRDFRSAGGKIKDDQPREKKERRPAKGERGERPARSQRKADGDRPGRERREFKDRREAGAGKERRDFKDRRPKNDARPERPERKPRPAETGEAGEERTRRPLDLKRLGRTPSISADKEIVINRPAWRQRKKKDNNEE